MPTFYEKLCAYDKTKEVKRLIKLWESALKYYTSDKPYQHQEHWEDMGSFSQYDIYEKIRALEKELDKLIQVVG